MLPTMSKGTADSSKYSHWNDLAIKARSGDKRAYKTLIDEVIIFARTVLSGSLANYEWVDDVIQDTLISMHKALPTYEEGRSFKAWLSTIMSYRKADFLRKVYANKSQEMSSFDDLVEKNMDPHVTLPAHVSEYRDVEKALEQIPDKQREIFILARVEGYSAKEVAQIKNMSVSAVKVSVHRTAKRIKELLE